MNARKLFSQALVMLGLVAMLLGAFDPLEGSLLILPGSGLVALGALVGGHSQQKLLGLAFVLVTIGVGAMFALSAVGGVGADSGRSMWWLLTVLPYPIGWLMGLVGVIALVGGGWHRILFGIAVLLSVIGLGTLILLCAFQGVLPAIPRWLLVTLPHGLSLITTIVGGILWITRSFRASTS